MLLPTCMLERGCFCRRERLTLVHVRTRYTFAAPDTLLTFLMSALALQVHTGCIKL